MATVAPRSLLKIHDVSRRLNVSEGTVRVLIRKGDLRAHRIGRLIMVDDAAVDAFLSRAVIAPREEQGESIPRGRQTGYEGPRRLAW